MIVEYSICRSVLLAMPIQTDVPVCRIFIKSSTNVEFYHFHAGVITLYQDQITTLFEANELKMRRHRQKLILIIEF